MATQVQKKTAKWGIGISLGSILGLINPELTRHVLNDAWQSTLAQAFVVITVVWFTMGRKVAKGVKEFQNETLRVIDRNFERVESGFSEVSEGLSKLEATMQKELSSHSKMISLVNVDVAKLDARVMMLEQVKKAIEGQGEDDAGR
jgi:hypothetical protein